MRAGDTIVALSSGALPSGVAVVRLSGPEAGLVVAEMLGSLPVPRRLVLSDIFVGGEILDRGLVAWMPRPASFTGEDCAELHVHGSAAVVRALLRRLVARPGIRLAEAGEFTRRAFENGKLNLVEAQGLGDLIEAETENQRLLARARLEGGLTRAIEDWRERLLDLRAEIEAQLDFSDEGDVGALADSFSSDLDRLRTEMAVALRRSGQGRILRSGFRVVLAGRPNAGKSSLLNALSRSDAAIVSDEPGTTRDLKEVPLDVDGQLIILTDSAGIRTTESRAEALGIERARTAMAAADLVLWLIAADQPSTAQPEMPAGLPPVLRVGTKLDLGRTAGVDCAVSTLTGEGLEALERKLYDLSGAAGASAADLLVSHERDRQALASALESLGRAVTRLDASELVAEDLRQAAAALERLLGRMDAEAVLDRLFSAFCIGK